MAKSSGGVPGTPHRSQSRQVTSKDAGDESVGDKAPTGPAEAGRFMTRSATAQHPARFEKDDDDSGPAGVPPPHRADPHGVLAEELEEHAFMPGQEVIFKPSGAECTVTGVKKVGPEGDQTTLFSVLTKDQKHAFDVTEDQLEVGGAEGEQAKINRIMAARAANPKRYGLDVRQAKEIRTQEKARALEEKRAARASARKSK